VKLQYLGEWNKDSFTYRAVTQNLLSLGIIQIITGIDFTLHNRFSYQNTMI